MPHSLSGLFQESVPRRLHLHRMQATLLSDIFPPLFQSSHISGQLRNCHRASSPKKPLCDNHRFLHTHIQEAKISREYFVDGHASLRFGEKTRHSFKTRYLISNSVRAPNQIWRKIPKRSNRHLIYGIFCF